MRSLIFKTMLGLCIATSAVAAPPPKPEPNIEAVRAAIDPAQEAPIVEPVYGGGKYASDGGPGGYWPERAQRLLVNGVAVMRCTLGAAGALNDCSLLAEGPTTFYFGEAALVMVRDGGVKAKPADGVKAGDAVRVIIKFGDVKKYVG